jgi:hypothetical protein
MLQPTSINPPVDRCLNFEFHDKPAVHKRTIIPKNIDLQALEKQIESLEDYLSECENPRNNYLALEMTVSNIENLLSTVEVVNKTLFLSELNRHVMSLENILKTIKFSGVDLATLDKIVSNIESCLYTETDQMLEIKEKKLLDSTLNLDHNHSTKGNILTIEAPSGHNHSTKDKFRKFIKQKGTF